MNNPRIIQKKINDRSRGWFLENRVKSADNILPRLRNMLIICRLRGLLTSGIPMSTNAVLRK